MKKIMFNDNVKLTQLVIEELKTNTRRIIPQSELDKINQFQEEYYDLTFDKLEGVELIKHYYLVEKRARTCAICRRTACASGTNGPTPTGR